MEAESVVAFRAGPDHGDEPSVGASALAEIDAAIALVEAGAAIRVRLVALPFVETIAAVGLARARAAGVGFAYERGTRVGSATVTVGPLQSLPTDHRVFATDPAR